MKMGETKITVADSSRRKGRTYWYVDFGLGEPKKAELLFSKWVPRNIAGDIQVMNGGE